MATQTQTVYSFTYTKTQKDTYFADLAERMMAKKITSEEAHALLNEKYPDIPTYLHDEEDPADCLHCRECGENRGDVAEYPQDACECGEWSTYRVTTDNNGEETYTLYCKKN